MTATFTPDPVTPIPVLKLSREESDRVAEGIAHIFRIIWRRLGHLPLPSGPGEHDVGTLTLPVNLLASEAGRDAWIEEATEYACHLKSVVQVKPQFTVYEKESPFEVWQRQMVVQITARV